MTIHIQQESVFLTNFQNLSFIGLIGQLILWTPVESELGKEFLSSMDRRLGEHDSKIIDVKRDYTELSQEINKLMERINMGISPSLNEVRKENAEIKLSISDLSHELKLSTLEMKGVVRESAEHTRLMIKNFDDHKLTPITNEVGFIKKTFIYGLVGALIVFLGQKGMSVIWEKVFKQDVVLVR